MSGESENDNGWDEHKKLIMHRLDTTDDKVDTGLDRLDKKVDKLIETRQQDVANSRKERAEQFKQLHDALNKLTLSFEEYKTEGAVANATTEIRLTNAEKALFGVGGGLGLAVVHYVLNTILNLI